MPETNRPEYGPLSWGFTAIAVFVVLTLVAVAVFVLLLTVVGFVFT